MDTNTWIEDLDLSVTAYNRLKRANIATVADLIALSGLELIAIRNMTRSNLIQILKRLEVYGFRLRDYSPDKYPTIESYIDEQWEYYYGMGNLKVDNVSMETPIESSGLSIQIANKLKKYNIVTFGDLVNSSVENLLAIHRISRKILFNILTFLDEKGYRLSDCPKKEFPDLAKFVETRITQSYAQRKSHIEKFLIVVDMQVDFITGSLGSEMAQAILPNVIEKVKAFDGIVIFTRDTHLADYLQTQEGKKLPVPHCIKDTKGWEICDELKPYVKRVVDKVTFGSTELPAVIKRCVKNVKEIELCGLCTDICVISNAMILKAAFPEAKISVDAKCCAGVSIEGHNTALEAMKAVQIEVQE